VTEGQLVPTTVVLASKSNARNKILVFKDDSVVNRWMLPHSPAPGPNAINSMEVLQNVLAQLSLQRSCEFRILWSIQEIEGSDRVPIYVWRVLGDINPDTLNSPGEWFDMQDLQITEEQSQSSFRDGDDLLIGMLRLKQEQGNVDLTWFGDFTELRERLREILHPQEILQELWQESEDRN
jgi:hypothetical protein